MTTTNNIKNRISRGDIFYIDGDPNNPPIGAEMWSDRAGLIVSNNGINNHSDAVQIVYLSTSKKKHLSPTHVSVTSGNKTAIAICEQIHTVDKSRLKDYFGSATESEMKEIDEALLFGLQINTGRNPQGIFRKWENYLRKYKILTE